MTNKVQGNDIDWAVGLALETAALDAASKPASLQLGGTRPCTHPHAPALTHDWRKAYAQTRACTHICARARMNTHCAQHSTALPALPALTAHALLVCGPQPWHFTSGHTGAP